MDKRHFVIMMFAVMAAGFAGGAGGRLIFREEPAYAQAAGTVIASKTFQINDSAGNPRIILSTSSDDNTPLIGMYDEKTQARAAFNLSEKGEPTCALTDGSAKLRMVLTVLEEQDTAAIVMFDKNDAAFWSIPE